MSDFSLERISVFNRELVAFAAAGVPLDIGNSASGEAIAGELEKFSVLLSRRVGRGQTVEQAIAEEPELPPRYRMGLWAFLRCDDPTIALDAVAMPADAQQEFRRDLGQAMTYPLIVMSLAYFGFLYLCSVTAPRIEAIYEQLWQQPSESLSLLTAGRNFIPIWAPLLPLMLFSALIWWRRRSPRWSWTWVPGSSKYFSAMRNAGLAHQLAKLMESGCSLEESLALVQALSSNAKGRGTNGTRRRAGGDVSTDSMPSLLRWALEGDLGGEPMPRVLRFVSQTYRQTAQRQQTLWRVVAPVVCGVLLGGMFVLGYALSLFLPMIQLLKDISVPGGV